MKDALVCVVALLVAGATALRIVQILRRETHPPVATWVMFEIAVVISFLSYLKTPEKDIISNITNTLDVLTVSLILIVLFFVRDRERWKVRSMDILCLMMLTGVLTFWLVRRDAFATNLATQAILVIAYLPTYTKMWQAGSNTESFLAWGIMLLSAIAGLAVAIISRDFLSMVYTSRAIVLMTALLAFMAYLERHPRKGATQ